jgi:nicotinate phosphoribosyltransferase
MPLHVASLEDIRSGRATDVYFDRTRQILEAKGIRKRVRAEFVAKTLPDGWPWAILAGLEECVAVLEGFPVNVRSMSEGRAFRPFQPVLEIEGPYLEFGVLETALLGLLCQASGVATRAARCKHLAGERLLLSFGARRMHPTLAPMIERAAFIGGCDGVSVLAAADLVRQDPTGTMPHALILILGDTVAAARAFDEIIAPEVPRVVLIDTFHDEKFEALAVAEALGERVQGLRLDTPGSRRGNFAQILQEVRWELDLRGYKHIQLYVSGGIGEREIAELAPYAQGFGVGTCISDAPVVDFAMDITEVEGQPFAKRGKWAGAKQVWRCSRCGQDEMLALDVDGAPCSCGGSREALLQPLLQQGRVVAELPQPSVIREAVMGQLRQLPLEP